MDDSTEEDEAEEQTPVKKPFEVPRPATPTSAPKPIEEEEEYIYVDEEGNPVPESEENVIYVDEEGNEVTEDEFEYLLE
jgi:hypothetical protein